LSFFDGLHALVWQVRSMWCRIWH